MNTQQLAAYEALCEMVPEANCATIERTDYDGGAWWIDSCRIESRTALAILTAHLEAMLPHCWWLTSPDGSFVRWVYRFMVRDAPTFISDPDRFIALCKAVEVTA